MAAEFFATLNLTASADASTFKTYRKSRWLDAPLNGGGNFDDGNVTGINTCLATGPSRFGAHASTLLTPRLMPFVSGRTIIIRLGGNEDNKFIHFFACYEAAINCHFDFGFVALEDVDVVHKRDSTSLLCRTKVSCRVAQHLIDGLVVELLPFDHRKLSKTDPGCFVMRCMSLNEARSDGS